MYQIPDVDDDTTKSSKPNIRIIRNKYDNSEVIITNDINHFIN